MNQMILLKDAKTLISILKLTKINKANKDLIEALPKIKTQIIYSINKYKKITIYPRKTHLISKKINK
jgi:hypothetical protein